MKKTGFRTGIFLFLLFFWLAPVRVWAQEDKEEGDVTHAPYFFIENADPSLDSFPLKATDVATNINGVIAETLVQQTYTNEGTRPINASYVFPASTKVSVHGMKMTIGDRTVTAQIREKEEAKEEFEQAKSEGKSASLLEQQRANVFTMSVANIMPGDVVRIELHYTEMISPVEGSYQFVFPTVVGPRYASPSMNENGETAEWVETPYLEEGKTPDAAYNITVNLSTGVPITEVSCKSHDIDVAHKDGSTAKITLSDPTDYAGNRDFILDYRLTGDQLNSGIMLYEGEEENFFALMVQPPEHFEAADIPGREYIFVLDISGSMYGYPLDTAKELIRDLVGSLREDDCFNVILFADEVASLSSKSLPATAANIGRAISLIDSMDGGGGTELLAALQKATALPAKDSTARSIVMITDGYIYGEKAIFEHISKNLDSAGFFSFGIGTTVNRYLIEGMAEVGMGEAFVVTDEEDAAAMAKRFRTYVQAPLLTDIQVDFEGFEVYDVQPAVQSTLYAQKPVVLFGKWKGEAAGTVRITGKTGRNDYLQQLSVDPADSREENAALPWLWARQKVKQLSDYTADAKEAESIKREITEIGLRYSMMTEYTSFIAVLDTVRNTEGSTDVEQPSPLPEGVSGLAVSTGYTIGSEPGEWFLLCLALLVSVSGTMLRYKRRRRGCEA